MTMTHKAILFAAGLVVFASGCVIDATPTRGPYEACNAGDLCGGGTTCAQAMYSVSVVAGKLNKESCSAGPQCPVSPYFSTYLPTCVVNASTGQGLCYDTCLSSADCGGGTQCALIPGTANRICVPAN